MRKRVLSILAAAGLAACSDTSAPPQRQLRPADPAAFSAAPTPDQYIVVFDDNVADPAGLARNLATANGATIRAVYKSALKGFAGRMSSAAAATLAASPQVAYVEPDQLVRSATTQVMDGFGDPWGLDRIDAVSGLSGSYTYVLTGAGASVYLVDTGIRATHAEFAGRVSGGFTAVDDGNGTNDCHGHGTAVAGIVGGSTYGVAKSVSLVPVRVLDCAGSGAISTVVAGIDWITANHGARAVANLSVVTPASFSMDQAVRKAIKSGVTVVAAAGNGDGSVGEDACNFSPGGVADAITVGATAKGDAKMPWSNYGHCVDLFAPGEAIKTASNSGDAATLSISGTSFSAPHAAGVAAMYLQANPTASPKQVRDALFDATTKRIITSSNTQNNHLLYSPPGGFVIRHTPPTAAFVSSCTNLTCAFTDQSTDNVGVTGWSWKFGDGAVSNQPLPSHTYSVAGTYKVSLTATDNGGETNSITQPVVVPTVGTVSVTGSRTKGAYIAHITWSGFIGSNVNLYRNGILLATPPNTGSYTDSGKVGPTVTYKICEIGSAACSQAVTADF